MPAWLRSLDPRWPALATVVATVSFGSPARAADDKEGEEPELSRDEVSAWLDAKALPADIGVDDAPEAPPPPPRDYGFVVETGGGAMGHIGELQEITPMMPWFFVRFGWEPAKWVMLLAQGEVAFGTTRLANPPPEPRSFALWGVGAGVRFTWEPSDRVGLWVQGEIGGGAITEDVLATYGFNDADQFGAHFGGLLGFEWYQINPHYALVLQGGVRNYGQVFDRQLSGATPLAWTGSAGLQYTF